MTGGKTPTSQGKISAFQANAKQITQRASKPPSVPKPALNLNPPAPAGAIRRQAAIDAAAAKRNALAVAPKKPAPAKPTAAFTKAASPTQKSAAQGQNTSLQMKRDFAKATAKNTTASFNRAARLTRTPTR